MVGTPLHRRLELVDRESVNKKNQIKFIFSLVENNFDDFCEIFNVDDNQKYDDILDNLYCEILNSLKTLEVNYQDNSLGQSFFLSKGEVPDSVLYKLGWIKLIDITPKENKEETARNELIARIKRNASPLVIVKTIFGFEPKIEIDSQEIQLYIDSSKWLHRGVLTSKGKNMLSSYRTYLVPKKVDTILNSAHGHQSNN